MADALQNDDHERDGAFSEASMRMQKLGLDFTGAAISRDSIDNSSSLNRTNSLAATPSILLPNQQYVNHFSVDIGGSLVKLVYFSHETSRKGSNKTEAHQGGRLHFVKFETSRLPQLFDFIESKRMHILDDEPEGMKPIVKVTGGGAYKHAEDFKDRLGLEIEKVDEMESLVTGANFLLSVIEDEAFTYPIG